MAVGYDLSAWGIGFMKPVKVFFLFMLLPCLATNSWAALTGQGGISFNNGLYASGNSCADSACVLSWKVLQLENGNYEYHYTFFFPNDARNVSHIIIQVSKNFTASSMQEGTTPDGMLGTWDGGGKDNQGIPAPIYGIRWNMPAAASGYKWTIVTDRAPMFGNYFYGREGNTRGGAVHAYSGTSWGFGNNVVVPGPAPYPSAARPPASAALRMAGTGKRME